MSKVSAIMRCGPAQFFHWCPACEMMHPLPFSWSFDGNVDQPTFSPSFRQGYVHWTGGIVDYLGKGEKQHRECHYIITAGQINFCSDSWHGRSDSVPMPPIPQGVDE